LNGFGRQVIISCEVRDNARVEVEKETEKVVIVHGLHIYGTAAYNHNGKE